jgi:general secretion pathway protein F/type IV pilus assembly protein PilC
MDEFAYIARDSSGQRVTGTIAAANRREALSLISGKALFPVEVSGKAPPKAVGGLRRLSAQTLAVLYGQLSDLLHSGVPLLRSLDVLRKQSTRLALTNVLAEVHHDVEQGSSLGEAMQRFPKIFGEMAISMVRAGSEGGFLEEALARVAEFTETQDDIKKRTVGALAYPAFLAVVGTIVVVVLMVFFVPNFEGLFQNLRERGELPIMTELVLGTSNFMQRWFLWIVLGVVALAVAARQWLATERGRMWRDRFKIRVPLAGKVFLNLAVARFCRVLGTLLRNGVPIIRSLEIAADAAGNRVLSTAILAAAKDISAGQRLAGPLAAGGHFPPTVVEMISVAEESSTLEKVLVDIAQSLERRTWRQLDLVVRLLEPIMLLLLAMVVLVLVIALLLPIIKMSMTV